LIEFLEGGFCGLAAGVFDLFGGEDIPPLEGDAVPVRCGALFLGGADIDPPLEGDDMDPPLGAAPPPLAPWFILWDKAKSGLNVNNINRNQMIALFVNDL
jgi:hypothetical protein